MTLRHPIRLVTICAGLFALAGCGLGGPAERTSRDEVVLIENDATVAGPGVSVTWTLNGEAGRQQVRNPGSPEIVHDDEFEPTEADWRMVQNRTEDFLAAVDSAEEVECTDTGGFTVRTSGWLSEEVTRSDCGEIPEKEDLFEFVRGLALARAGPFVSAGDQVRIRRGDDQSDEVETTRTGLRGRWDGEPVEAELAAVERAELDRAITAVLRSEEPGCADGTELEISVPDLRKPPWVSEACPDGAGGELLDLLDDLADR